MQKKLLALLLASLLLAACGERDEPGSSLAAQLMAAEFVGKVFNVAPVHVYEAPGISGDLATVTTIDKDRKCKLELVKKLDANKYGWVTNKIDCNKVR